jgi:hypothetical protein
MMVTNIELAQVAESSQENEASKFSKMKHSSVPVLEHVPSNASPE